jgi:hypothetical protein
MKMDPTVPNAVPARMIETIMQKHDGLKCLRVSRVGTAADVRDPGFASMKQPQEVLNGIIGIFNTAGFSVAIADQAGFFAVSRDKLIAGGQALYDLFLRHQWQRKLERAVSSSGALLDDESMQKMAEQYMGRSRADVKKLEEEVMLKDSMLKNLESYLQDFATKAEADKTAAAEALAQAMASVKASQAMVAEAEAKAQVKAEADAKVQVKVEAAPGVKAEAAPATPSVASGEAKWSSTDYLADIYDDCIDLTKGVNAVTQLRQSACADVKPFDGRTRDEFRGKSFISSIRSAFRQDGLTNGQCCIKFPEMLTGVTKIWYKQLPKDIRKDWNKLQAEFEREYCGAAVTPHQRYYELRRKPTEEPLDYLYRLNVQAMEAGIDFAGVEGSFHVTHFLDTCEDPDLARQFGLAKPTTELGLRTALKELLRQSQRAKRDDAIKTRTDKRDKGFKSAASGSKQNPILVNALAKLQAAAGRLAADADESAGESEGEWPSDSDTDEVESDESTLTPSLDDFSSVLAPASIEALAKVIAALQGRDKPTKGKPDAVKHNPCSHCGSKRHSDRDCWARITCTVCGRAGHPAEYCYHRCKGCGNVHERGACPLEEVVNQLKTWFDPVKHAGILPADVEKMLN